MANQTVLRDDIIEEVKSIGWDYLDHKQYSSHPDDWFLQVVIAARPNRTEYVTWLYNASLGGLHGGRYFVSLESAMTDFNLR
jgi:hypothetical protein